LAIVGRILVVDDNVALAENVAEILQLYGYRAFFAGSAEEALSLLDHEVGALVTDFRMGAQNGAELITEIRRRGSQIPAFVVSAHGDDRTISACTRAGALAVLAKPIAMTRLLELVGAL
jgi:DNA-binding NtrC family response regulator